MVNVIVLFPKQEVARSIRNLLVRSGFEVTAVCATGAQVVQRMEGVEEGLVVCGYKCSDMIYSESVSYTHLDVYKRQHEKRVLTINCRCFLFI